MEVWDIGMGYGIRDGVQAHNTYGEYGEYYGIMYPCIPHGILWCHHTSRGEAHGIM